MVNFSHKPDFVPHNSALCDIYLNVVKIIARSSNVFGFTKCDVEL